MGIDKVLSTKNEVLNTQKLKSNKYLVLSNLEVLERVKFIVEGLGTERFYPWYCKAYRILGEEKMFTIVSVTKTGKNPKTLFGYLLKQELNNV